MKDGYIQVNSREEYAQTLSTLILAGYDLFSFFPFDKEVILAKRNGEKVTIELMYKYKRGL